MDWTEDFAQAIVNNTAISLSQGPGGAVSLKMAEIQAATETLANSIEHSLIRSGYNEIGQIASITGGSNNIVTLVSRPTRTSSTSDSRTRRSRRWPPARCGAHHAPRRVGGGP
jgi:hypothetical protein